MKSARTYPWFLAIFTALLLFSIHGVIWIPFWSSRGLDLQNLHAFHHACPGWPIRYGASGSEFGDALGRGMFYPPLLYWMMSWTRLGSFYLSEIAWSVAIPLLTGLATALIAWADRETNQTSAREKREWRTSMLWLLLLLQMPMLYAIERGNNDALVLPVYCAGVLCFVRGRIAGSGALLAAATWLKVYPFIPVFILCLALLPWAGKKDERLLPFTKAYALTGLAIAVATLPDSWIYLTRVLPSFASQPGGFGTSSHTLFRGIGGLVFKSAMIIYWAAFTRRILASDLVLALSAGPAIATFFPNVSNDYNLITAYPFLFVLFSRRVRERMTLVDGIVVLWTVWAFVGDRTPLEHLFPNRSALLLQVGWFLFFPIYVLRALRERSWFEEAR